MKQEKRVSEPEVTKPKSKQDKHFEKENTRRFKKKFNQVVRQNKKPLGLLK